MGMSLENSGQTKRTDSLPGKKSVLILVLNRPTSGVHFNDSGLLLYV